AETAVKLQPTHVQAWLLIGDMQRALGADDRALAAFASAAQAAPRELAPRMAFAELLASTGRWAPARSEYRRAADMHPQSLRAALGAALLLPAVYEGKEHLEKSRQEYAEGLERLHALADGFRFPG